MVRTARQAISHCARRVIWFSISKPASAMDSAAHPSMACGMLRCCLLARLPGPTGSWPAPISPERITATYNRLPASPRARDHFYSARAAPRSPATEASQPRVPRSFPITTRPFARAMATSRFTRRGMCSCSIQSPRSTPPARRPRPSIILTHRSPAPITPTSAPPKRPLIPRSTVSVAAMLPSSLRMTSRITSHRAPRSHRIPPRKCRQAGFTAAVGWTPPPVSLARCKAGPTWNQPPGGLTTAISSRTSARSVAATSPSPPAMTSATWTP